jgi:hypothetical protein
MVKFCHFFSLFSSLYVTHLCSKCINYSDKDYVVNLSHEITQLADKMFS